MLKESPFLLSKVECPICKTVNEFETIKVGAYVENGRDTDFCPMGITWRHSRYEAYNPLLYFTATCTHCHYTREFNNKFKEWKNDNNYRTYRLKTIKQNHLEKMAPADSVLRKLGGAIDISHFPNESAIIKLLLACYDELLADRPIDLDLGRFYLRIAWVFRYMTHGENPGNQFIRGLTSELSTKFNSLTSMIVPFHDEVDKFGAHISSHFVTDELSSELKSELIPYKEKFELAIKDLLSPYEGMTLKLQNLESLITDYKETALGGFPEDGTENFQNFGSFAEFLNHLKDDWGGMVTNEHEAMEKAVYHYKEAMEDSKSIAAGNQQIQATYLIAELSRRIGDFDGAKQYFNITIKYGQEFVYKNRQDQSRTALARKILELAIEQGKLNLEASKKVS